MSDKNKTEKYLTKQEAADYLSVHPETLQRWEDEGKIKPFKLQDSNYRRYTKDQLDDLLIK